MKKSIMLPALMAAIAFSACTSSTERTSRTDVNNLVTYVDSVDKLEPVYTESQWAMIDEGYNERVARVDKASDLDAADKAKVEESKTQYKTLGDRYEVKIKESAAPVVTVEKNRVEVRNQLLGEGRPGPDNRWDFVTPQNVVTVYQDFVDRVRKYGDNYKDEDWDEVRSLWKSLNARKDEIDKDMSAKDNAKVAGLRVAYTAIKSVNRPVSKVKEEIQEEKKD